MLSVQNYSLVTKQPSFKAEQNENKKPVQKPFTTNAGLKTGAVYAGIETAILLGFAGLAKLFPKNGKKVDKLILTLLAYLPVGIGASLGCGAIVDKIINKKHASFADRLEKEGKDKVLKSDDNADYTFSKNVYYKSDIGKKIGTALGVVASPLLSTYSSLIFKSPIKGMTLLNAACRGTIGGLILGAITDSITNNNARKHADIQAKKQKNKI